MIVEEAQRLGIKRRAVGDDEILDRTLYALINEGARLLGEGIVERASDIDLCYVYGMGFPAARGGPMALADSVGLKRVHDAVVALHAAHDDNWAPAPLLGELARSGRSFSDFDKATGVA
jgi:3-hydroxyacyl-CoA dehydrogenase